MNLRRQGVSFVTSDDYRGKKLVDETRMSTTKQVFQKYNITRSKLMFIKCKSEKTKSMENSI